MTRGVRLAGKLGPDDWRQRSSELVNAPSVELWKDTGVDFLMNRIEPRYLVPIREMKRLNKFQGEGFAVVTIQCALIEFLAALLAGENYKRKSPNKNNHEYNDSKNLFECFLSRVTPFSDVFKDDLAAAFYTDIRCGLLHEGQTKGGWLVLKKDSRRGQVVELGPPRVLYWDALQDIIDTYLVTYLKDLETDASLQAAFERKFSHLANSAA